MNAAELLLGVQHRLNRPAEDDKFPPDVIFGALFDAARALRREIGLFEPDAIAVEKILPPTDATGSSYTLAEVPHAGLRVFTPPGPVRGVEIFPTDFGQDHGYVLAGTEIRLVQPRIYNPGLYVRYVAAVPTVNAGMDTLKVLPEWAHTAWKLLAAAKLARTPGSRINTREVEAEYSAEWGEVRRQRKMLAPAHTPEDVYPAWYEGMA